VRSDENEDRSKGPQPTTEEVEDEVRKAGTLHQSTQSVISYDDLDVPPRHSNFSVLSVAVRDRNDCTVLVVQVVSA